MRIVLLFGTEWSTSLVEPIVYSGHEAKGSVFIVSKRYRKYIPISFIRRALFRMSVFLKLNFGFRSNRLIKTVGKFRIPIVIMESVNSHSFMGWLKKEKIDLILIAGWEEILAKEIISIPALGCINCHPSLLPLYRGANPFYWVIINKEAYTGITYHYVNEAIDAGDIVYQDKVVINDSDTAGMLAEKCADTAARYIPTLLKSIASGKVTRLSQDVRKGSYYGNIADGLVDLNKSIGEVCNYIRALIPWVKPYIISNGRKIAVMQPEIVDVQEQAKSFKSGDIISKDKNGLLVACQDGCLRLQFYK